jgi:hypothetical protein
MAAPRDEDRRDSLLGTLVPSETTPGVAYRLISHMTADGGMLEGRALS